MSRTRRPASPLATPVRLENAFCDPEGLLALIRGGAPYKTQEAAHKHPGVTRTSGWFRNFWALGGKVVMDGAEPFFLNPTFIEAAKASFNAEIVEPVAMMTNLNLPMAGLDPHLDLPFFRGAMNREVPAWLLVPMGYCGLFQDWAVPVASAITWFYDGEGGAFEYWPDGLDHPSRVEKPPYFNTAVLADNEYMYHRVGSLGLQEEWLADDAIPFDARLYLEGDRWVVRDGPRQLHAHAFTNVRVSVLWKAHCFRNEAEAAAFHDHSEDLTPEIVTRIFVADLGEKGFDTAKLPSADIRDDAWKPILEAAYPAPRLSKITRYS